LAHPFKFEKYKYQNYTPADFGGFWITRKQSPEKSPENGFQIFIYLEGGHDAMISQPNEIAEMFISMLK
jgi:hypothetical protein